MKSRTGASEFRENIAVFIKNPHKVEKDFAKFPTISTLKDNFPPSLACYLIQKDESKLLQINQNNPLFEYCCILNKILSEIKEGKISYSGDLKDSIFNKIKKYQFRKNNSQIFFDLLYTALQFYAYFKGNDYKELFLLCADHIYSIKTGKINYEAHVDHFMVHAAAFLSADSSRQKWSKLKKNIINTLEDWGLPSPDRNIIIHALFNLKITCKGIPEEDFAYDMIKNLRSRYKKKEIELEDVCETLNKKIGWKISSEILKILWRDIYKKYYEYNRDLIQDVIRKTNIDVAVNLAKEISFVSKSNFPYIKNYKPAGEENKCLLSFPGGTTIGYTSTLCRIGSTRILIDYGTSPFGRAPVWSPEIDMVDAVLITHAHQDHIGGLFKLYEEGYKGLWYASEQTKPLVELALTDSMKLNKDSEEQRNVYSEARMQFIMQQSIPLYEGEEFNIKGNISVKPFSAGHIPGSLQYLVKTPETSVFFTGDFNTEKCASARPIQIPDENERYNISALVIEGTYAFREETIIDTESAKKQLLKEVSLSDKFPVLIPVLSLGRAQEVLHALSGTKYRVGVFGLARKMTLASKMKFKSNIMLDYFRLDDVRRHEFDIIVASAGCLQGGPSQFFFNHPVWGQPPTILTGYLFPGTPARNLQEELPRIRYSAHSPHKIWRDYIKLFPNADIYLIHYPQSRNKAEKINVTVPYIHREYPVELI